MSVSLSCFVASNPAFVASTAVRLPNARARSVCALPRSAFLAAPPDAPPDLARPHPRHARLPVTCTTNVDPGASPLRPPQVAWPARPNVSPQTMGRLMLMCVPIIWASYSIIIKYMYSMTWTLGPATFNALRLLFSLIPMFPSMVRYLRDRVRQKRANGAPVFTPTVRGGLELGVWTCIVNILQLVGLRHTAASRGAFLTQLCTVIVPVAAFANGSEPSLSRNVLTASLMSVAGVGLLTLDDAMSPFTWLGDGSLLLSAFVSAAYVMRSKTFAGRSDGGPMVAFKVLSQLLVAIAWMCFVNAKTVVSWTATRAAMANAMVGATPATMGISLLFMLFTGLVLSVGSTVIQIRGQKMVSASEAVVIFTSTPLWTALMAIPLGERFGMRGMVGAFLIFVATMLCSKPDKKLKAVESG